MTSRPGEILIYNQTEETINNFDIIHIKSQIYISFNCYASHGRGIFIFLTDAPLESIAYKYRLQSTVKKLKDEKKKFYKNNCNWVSRSQYAQA